MCFESAQVGHTVQGRGRNGRGTVTVVRGTSLKGQQGDLQTPGQVVGPLLRTDQAGDQFLAAVQRPIILGDGDQKAGETHFSGFEVHRGSPVGNIPDTE